MKTIIQIIIISLIVGFTSCKKADVTEFSDIPVISSYLEPGDTFNVTLSHQIPFSNTARYAPEDLNNLSTVRVNYNNVIYPLTPVGGGKYVNNALVVVPNAKYNLAFNFNSKSTTAYTYIPPKPTNYTQSVTEITLQKIDSTTNLKTLDPLPDPVQLLWDNTDASAYLVVVENYETGTLVPIRIFKGGRLPSSNRFKKTPTNSSGIQIRANEFQYFGKHRLILFHVLPDYATLYNQNSVSSQNLTNPSTSIVNGYGIFTGLDSDTLYIDVKAK